MKATVKKRGNRAAVRIPASLMEPTCLHIDEDVDVLNLLDRLAGGDT